MSGPKANGSDSARQAEQQPRTESGRARSVHVIVKDATDLLITEYGRKQNPYAVLKLADIPEEQSPRVWTGRVPNGGQNFNWTEEHNNHVYLHLPGTYTGRRKLIVELWDGNPVNDSMIGVGEADITDIVLDTTSGNQKEVAVHEVGVNLSHSRGARDIRGRVDLCVFTGPPMRPLVWTLHHYLRRAWEVRDALALAVNNSKDQAVSSARKAALHYWHRTPLSRMDRKALLLVSLGVTAVFAGLGGLALLLLLPLATIGIITFPMWIMPTLGIALVFSPVWLPLILISFVVASTVLGLLLVFHLTRQQYRALVIRAYCSFRESTIGQRLLLQPER